MRKDSAMKILSAAILAAVLSCVSGCLPNEERLEPVDYVNTYVGNISHLLVPVHPTVGLPHSMMRVFPMRRQVTDEYLAGLPLFVTSHRAESELYLGFPELKLSHDNEHITPYSYEAELAESTLNVRFSASHQSALYDIHSRDNRPVVMTVNAANGMMTASGNIVKGFQRVSAATRAYVYLEFEQTPDSACQASDGTVSLVFAGPDVRVRYGVSLISEDQAAANLAREIDSYDVEPLMAQGRRIWNDALGRIEVQGGSSDDMTVFYTSYYHTLERPVCISEDGRYWSGEDNQIHDDGGVPYYTDDWLWDTYHSAHPLRTIVDAPLEEAVLASYLRMSDENPHGWLPCFPGVGGAGRAMNCCHGIVSLADAQAKGLDIDVDKAAEAAARSLRGRTVVPWSNAEAGILDQFYWAHGYLPALREGEKETDPNVHGFENRQPIPVTTGTSYDCWAASRLAGAAGHLEDQEYFFRHSFDYRNLFNRETGFFHPKDSRGAFIEPFDYNFPGGMGAREYYDENNAWVYRWDVQHNVYDLISLMGGDERFVAQLDSMFAEPLGMDKYDFYAKMPDHTGNVGQFSMGNEPSLHVPYLYNYAGAPWKTQKRIRQMLKTWFRNDYMGMPGDEDGGGMTSFVVFSQMGFFPVTPGKAEYSIGSPVFEDVKIHMFNGNTFEVKAHNVSDDNKYIQSARLNGKPWNEPVISHEAILAGAVLELEMGPLPNKEWGVGSSISYDSYRGLAMAGYQGWFTSVSSYIDVDNVGARVSMLPDATEYPDAHEVPVKLSDGSNLKLPLPADYSTVDVHFRWMKEYGLDGVFMQRFLPNIGRDHYMKVMDNAMSCAERYDRAICIMYDLSGGENGTMDKILLDDLDELNARYNLFDHKARPSYLWHNGKPLVVVWGVGFIDRPEYYMDHVQSIIDGIKDRGYSLMLGVPTYWREGGRDVFQPERLIEFIKQADIIMPWYVGRCENSDVDEFVKICADDLAWCNANGIDFAPNVWPGFGWAHARGQVHDDNVDRLGGAFMQTQIDAYLKAGVKSLYFAMFDEVNEGTAIYKIARDVPVSPFDGLFAPLEDGVPADIYLRIAGEAAGKLKN